MSFDSYIRNVEARTGRSIEQLVSSAQAEGIASEEGLVPGVKPSQALTWLKERYALGHGHGMAVIAYLKGKRS